MDSRFGKFFYGAAFTILLPVLLVVWARVTAPVVAAAVIESKPLGGVLAVAGLLLTVWGMSALLIHGRGLPMNPFPPQRYVTQSIYQFLPNPIYTGFSLVCIGAAIFTGSASGFWLVSPTVMLGCAALVLGYERHDLVSRFGLDVARPAKLLPADDLSVPTALERVKTYFCVLIPWFFAYESVVALGVPRDAISVYLPFEHRLPVVEWTELLYASTYLLTALAPIVAGTRRDLRAFCVRGLLAEAIVFPFYLVVPLIASPRPFVPQTFLGTLLLWERAWDSPAAALPSFHVIWALLTSEVFAARKPSLRWVWRGWAYGVAVSCVTTGMHALVDLLGGVAVVVFVSRAEAVWVCLREWTERLANSWGEWRVGPLRVMSHSVYAALAGFLAVLVAMLFAGPGHSGAVLTAAFAGIVGAALWAQFLEGSSVLLRPFGYYGALVGTSVGALFAPLFGVSIWLVLAAFAVCAPWVQAIGRLRCLVQGCCHGRPAPSTIGIRYSHPRSRAVRLTNWSGVPLHPTPLYSILWNLVVGAALVRLWALSASLGLIVGVYFILSGLGRFVEESFRGEPQTRILAGLRIYQWTALLSVFLGALLTAFGQTTQAPAPHFSFTLIVPAIAFGLFTAFAMGVDFPDSNLRFSRLV